MNPRPLGLDSATFLKVARCRWINKHQSIPNCKPCQRVLLLPTRSLSKETYFRVFINNIDARADTPTGPPSPVLPEVAELRSTPCCLPPGFPLKRLRQLRQGQQHRRHPRAAPTGEQEAARVCCPRGSPSLPVSRWIAV